MNSRLLVGILLSAILFWGCEENRRIITPIVPEGDHIILLEEFTGKGCSNCPKGSREIDNLVSLFGDNLVVVSIHAGFFANPDIFEIGQYDLRTDEGEALFDYLGPNSGYPAGVINRTPFNGELQLIANAWAAVITDELNSEPKVDFSLAINYNETNKTISAEVKGIMRESVLGDVRVSIMIAESGIQDAQDDIENGGIVEDYIHKHVLRDMLTKFDGESIGSNLIVGEEINQSYSGAIDPSWDPAKIDVIAFISLVQPDGSFKVLQAGQSHLIE